MRSTIFGGFLSIALLFLPLAGLAEGNADCNFVVPTGLLQPEAYHAYTYRRAADNEAFESVDITKDIHLEIRHDQCVDFLVQKFTFTLNASLNTSPLDFAFTEISNLKLSNPERKPNDLLVFLKGLSDKGATKGNFSACKDGSSAPPG
jgi:hypothetical protein